VQNLVRNGFSADQVKAALHNANRAIDFRYELVNASNQWVRDLTNVQEASITQSIESEIKRTARFTLLDDGSVNFLSQRIKPYVRIGIGSSFAEFPLGVFLLSTPTRRTGDARTVLREIEAYDQLQILKDDRVTGQYLISSGTGYLTAIKTLLDGAGVTIQNLTASDKTLPVDREWDGGTTKLQIINELLSALNYDPLFFDENGVAVARPYVSPDLRASEYTYVDNEASVIFPDVSETLDLFNIPNQFVLIVSQPDRPVLKSVYTNTNAGSPTSTVSRGRIISDYRSVDAADQTTLDSLAQSAAFKASQIYQSVDFSTAIMPQHSYNDVLTLRFSRLGIDAKYEEIGWTMPLKAGGQMQHTIRRVVTV
jgi:hypothetical protein